MAKDFYKILGVSRTADEKEIKRAYRKMARQYHPDANKGKDAEQRFKEINEAYQVLSDSEKRALYDQFGEDYDKVGQGAPPPGAGGGYPGGGFSYQSSGGGINFEDLLNQARRQQAAAGGHAGAEEADIGDLFSSFFGGRGQRSSRGTGSPFRGRSRPRKGQDIEQPMEISLRESINGATRALQLVLSDPLTGQQHQRNVTVKIPAGVREGARVRIKGQGGPGERGGENGDLYLKIRIKPHPFWKREGDNLHCELPISFGEAALGAVVDVPTIDSSVKMRIPAGTQSGQVFRLSGRGVPRPPQAAKNGAKNGDLFVKVHIATPKNLSAQETELIRELSSQRNENLRANLQTTV